MATNIYRELPREHYSIATEYDLVVRVIEYEQVEREEGNDGNGRARKIKESVPKKAHELKVKRDILAKNSTYFNKLLSTRSEFSEAAQDRLDLHEDPAASVALWFKLLHGGDVRSTYTTTTIKGVWEILTTAHKYGFDPKISAAKLWFEGWYDATQSLNGGNFFRYDDFQMLLLPCHTFDYARGFQQTTKHLVYHALRHVTELKPDKFDYDHLRLDAPVIQQVNAAKGRLRTILHRGLYQPIETLLRNARCNCKEKTLYAYELALFKTGAWPLETAFQMYSVTEILKKLGNFSTSHSTELGKLGAFSVSREVEPQMCPRCEFSFKLTVASAVKETTTYFDGLCLDCMNASKPKFGDSDADYWNHHRSGVKWDKDCRIRHGQPTWYFSFLGRREKMIEWTEEKRKRKRGFGYDDDSD